MRDSKDFQVVIKLPQPVETCINKQVLLPRLECDQVCTDEPDYD